MGLRLVSHLMVLPIERASVSGLARVRMQTKYGCTV